MRKRNTAYTTQAALIAALYVVLTYLSSLFGLSSGVIQIRFSEALTVLPAYMPAAVPGLFVGCLLANFLTGGIALDVVVGSLATLVGAILTRRFGKRRILAPLFPVLANMLTVPFVLAYGYGVEGALWYFALTVGIGEVLSCGVLGGMVMRAFEKYFGKENRD